MNSSQEGLVERVMNDRGSAMPPAEARENLATLHGVLAGLSQKTVVVIFAMGKVLAMVKEQLPHGEFIPWIEENCQFDRIRAWSYIKVYEHYKDEPKRALAELSISEAYIEAGVKKLTAPAEDGAAPRLRGSGGILDDEPGPEEFSAAFKKPTLSGVALKHYRIAPYRNGTLYVVRPEIGVLPVCNLYANMAIEDPAYQAALAKAHQDLQLALEVFYSKVEELEDRGAIPAPFDSSRKAMVARMRNVSPEKKESAKAKPKPTKGKGGKK
ncbi:MAG TPA: DUF3102 domain-containing protein [Spirochaetales bacterium]|nr:DUF3102 domain-containing protein [Spirochaetales bacterium]